MTTIDQCPLLAGGIPIYGSGSWICPNCRDYNLDTQHDCVYCGRPQSEFRLWLAAVDIELADSGTNRIYLPYKLHQWWEMWDHSIKPDAAATTAMLLAPAEIKPWPEHYVYKHEIYRQETPKMTTLSITYSDTNNPTALACQYSGQHHPQEVYIALNLDDGTMWADYNGEIGNGVPESVWHGVVRRYPFPTDTIPTTDAANRIMDEIAPLAQSVLDNSSTGYNHNGNYVGGVDEAGREAEEEIEQELGRGVDESDSVGIIDAGDWWHTLTDEELGDMDEMSITAETTDEQIAALVPLYLEDMERQMGAVVCDDLEDYLLSRRNDMREQVTA